MELPEIMFTTFCKITNTKGHRYMATNLYIQHQSYLCIYQDNGIQNKKYTHDNFSSNANANLCCLVEYVNSHLAVHLCNNANMNRGKLYSDVLWTIFATAILCLVRVSEFHI